MEPLRDVALKEEVHSWELALKPCLQFVPTACFLPVAEAVVSQLLASAACGHSSFAVTDSPSGTVNQNQLFPKLPWLCRFII